MARACKKGTTGRKGQSDPIRSRLWSAEIRDAHLKMWKCENVASTNFANSNRRRSRPFFYEAPFLNWGEAHRASAGCRGGVSPCKTRRLRGKWCDDFMFFSRIYVTRRAQGSIFWYRNSRFERGMVLFGNTAKPVSSAVDALFAKTICTDGMLIIRNIPDGYLCRQSRICHYR